MRPRSNSAEESSSFKIKSSLMEGEFFDEDDEEEKCGGSPKAGAPNNLDYTIL